jgi:hypothetical protein
MPMETKNPNHTVASFWAKLCMGIVAQSKSDMSCKHTA